ncbi:hypothetical protein [Terrabacter sp. 2RAF25]|uniref:hypothetical protein n=1 Tax=Terrabacter sp. 2RAF25 TaxID=3232998 RepID=UPI003F96013C
MTACVGLALLSLLFNITLPAELEGNLQAWSFVRKSIGNVLNSGTAWAAVAFYAGWKMAKPWTAFLVGIGAAVATLLIHYVVGSALHIYEAGEVGMNGIWFQAAVVLCGPMGLVGWLAARRGWLSLLARLVVPLGAIMEPFVLRKFDNYPPNRPWAVQYSDMTSGVILIVLGVLAAGYVLRRGPAGLRHTRGRADGGIEKRATESLAS